MQTKTIEVGKVAEAIFFNKVEEGSGRALIYVESENAKQSLKDLEFTITSTKGKAFETIVKTNAFGQISSYLPVGEYTIAPVARGNKEHAAITPVSFKIEANKFTIVNLTF